MNVLVFKTSVSKPGEVSKVKALLTAIPAITDWNFDLEDCDNILRIETNSVCPRSIEGVLQAAGITCLELS
jgi:hypothetical protein